MQLSVDRSVEFDASLIAKYNKYGPRYTSYPTARQFTGDIGEDEFKQAILASNNADPLRPLSLYIHIPFCDTVCFYCACNKLATKDRSLTVPYLQRLYQEIEMEAALFDDRRVVNQLHWGGGTPTFLSCQEMAELMEYTRRYFPFAKDGEYSIEIDPREANAEIITFLRTIGFNRLSLGVQDFDETVQRAINRLQSEKQTREVLQAARQQGFQSIGVDLIYGLPHQNKDRFNDTLSKIIELDPDRISLFNYAHLPDMFKPQRRINEADLPSPNEKLEILQHSIERLTDVGYVFIGMDHFAKADDELAVAQENGKLHRNFQGYSTHADCDLLGLGVSSISMIGMTYAQNEHQLDLYYEALSRSQLPIKRGVVLTLDDQIRRQVISGLMCHFALSFAAIEAKFSIQFDAYFAAELLQLVSMQEDGLLQIQDRTITVFPKGRLLIRNVAMAFDHYLNSANPQRTFSQAI